MKHFVVTSLRKDAGKTSVIIGLAKLIKGQIGYLKPFGDRLLYRKKRLWDYDSAVISKIFNIEESPEGMSMGFDHSKLRYIYDADTAKEILSNIGTVNFGSRGSDREGESQSLWKDSLKSVLSEPQIKKYEHVVEERKQSEINAFSQMAVVSLDIFLRLTPD